MKPKLVEDMEVTEDNVLDVLDEIIDIMKSNDLVCFQSRNDLPEAMKKYNRKRKNKLFNIDMALLADICKCLFKIGLYADDYIHEYYKYFKRMPNYSLTNCRIEFFFLYKNDLVQVSMYRLKGIHGELLDNEIYYSLDIGNYLHYNSLYPISTLDLILEKYKLKMEIIKNFEMENA